MSTLRAVYANLAAARTTIRDVRRFRQIASVLVRHGFGFLFSRISRRDAAVAKTVEEVLEETAAEDLGPRPVRADGTHAMARRFRRAIEDLGPTFIKFGQILSTRPDLVPPAFSDELQGLQDDVPPMAAADVRKAVQDELGGPPEELFAEFDPEPIAAASIAQVHRGRLRTGEEVAIKIQRPRIRAIIEADLDILYFLARQLVQAIPETEFFDPPGIVREFEQAIRKELDFENEARNMEKFARNFRDVDYLHIPAVHRGFTTSKLLTMEFVHGAKITEAVERGLGDAEILARRALWSLFLQIYRHGFFHGDLHPGNILVLPENRLCYLDFGLAGRLTQDMKEHLVDLLVAVGRQDFDQLARVLYDIGRKDAPVDWDAYVADVYEGAERYFEDKPLAEVDVGLVFHELVQKAMRHRMHVPTAYTMVIKSMMTIEGLGKRLAPEMDLVAEAQPFIAEIVKERYSPERLARRALESVQTANRLLRRVPPAMTRLLEEAEAGRVTLKVEAPQLEAWLVDRRRSDTLWGLGLVFAVTTLSATLALSWDAWLLFGLPAISLVGYALAIPAGAMFFRAWWRR